MRNSQTQPAGLKSLLELMSQETAGATPSAHLPASIRAVLARPVSWFRESAAQAGTATAGEPLTNVAFVLDCSGSMETGKEATIEGFNTQVDVVRRGAALAGPTTFTDVRFATTVEVRRVAASLDHLTPLSDDTYRPDGYTALYDAVGDTVAALLETARIDEPTTGTLVTVFTDGEENHSRRYTAPLLRALIERLEATGRWTFALVGPRDTVGTLADMLAVDQTNVAGFDPASVADRCAAFTQVAQASAAYMSVRASGKTAAKNLYAGKKKG